MIRYEVNLHLNPEIRESYLQWLNGHIKEMLSFQGFLAANLYEDCEDSNRIIVCYDIENESDMNTYLENHAKTMRQEAEELFSGKFSASRRILKQME